MQGYYNFHHRFDRWSFSVGANQINFGTGLFYYCTCDHCGQCNHRVICLSVRSLHIASSLFFSFFTLLPIWHIHYIRFVSFG